MQRVELQQVRPVAPHHKRPKPVHPCNHIAPKARARGMTCSLHGLVRTPPCTKYRFLSVSPPFTSLAVMASYVRPAITAASAGVGGLSPPGTQEAPTATTASCQTLQPVQAGIATRKASTAAQVRATRAATTPSMADSGGGLARTSARLSCRTLLPVQAGIAPRKASSAPRALASRAVTTPSVANSGGGTAGSNAVAEVQPQCKNTS